MRSFVTFILDGVGFAADIKCVQEIKRNVSLTYVPGIPGYITGLYNMRGRIVTIFDLAVIFDRAENRKDAKNDLCVILKNPNGDLRGFAVDSAGDVISVADEQCQPPPANGITKEYRYTECVVRLGDHVLLEIDPNKIFDDIEKNGGIV